MKDDTKVDKTDETTSSEDTKIEKSEVTSTPDPLKAELDRVQVKKTRSETEKAAFSLMKNAERVKELGLDPKKVLGFDEEEESDDNQPITRGELRKIQIENAQKSALGLAEAISNPTERELVKHHLTSTIKPSGNAETDLANARAIVNSLKNSQIAEEVQRKTQAKRHSTGAGAPAKEGDAFEPTDEERTFMRPPWNMTEKQILEIRKKAQE